jgi:ligand-binding SRPBCC domain-containing protein
MTGPENTIRFETWINAPVERCFQIALHVETHSSGVRKRVPKVVAGVTSGRLSEGDVVTLESSQFGRRLRYTSRVEKVRPYSYFREVRVDGALSRFEHDHHFATMDDGTRMRDEITFSVPWGVLGKMATKMFVKKRLTELMMARSMEIKRVAESEDWARLLRGEQGAGSVAKENGKGWEDGAILRGSQG